MESLAGAFDGVFNGVVQISCFKGMQGVMVSVLRLGDDGLLSAKKLLHCVLMSMGYARKKRVGPVHSFGVVEPRK
jgi:inner membrane protein involved in colicin E2 resistance